MHKGSTRADFQEAFTEGFAEITKENATMTKSECVKRAKAAHRVVICALKLGHAEVAIMFRVEVMKLMRQARSYVGPGY